MKMQATTLNLPPPSLPYGLTKLPLSLPLPWFPKLRQPTTFRALQLKLKLKPTAAATNDTPTTVDYSSGTSVFPAEACETIGGEACDAEMYPEVKPPTPQPRNTATNTKESVDREYLQYDEPKTVFPGEACDDLGGEFCEPDYQTGVY